MTNSNDAGRRAGEVFARRVADDFELRAALFDASALLKAFVESDEFRILRLQAQSALEQRMAKVELAIEGGMREAARMARFFGIN